MYNGESFNDFKINEDGEFVRLSTGTCFSGYVHNGYIVATLHLGGKNNFKSVRVHRALAETFLDKPVGANVVHHKDGNKQNNDLRNLEWVSTSNHYEQHRSNLKRRKVLHSDALKIKTLINSFSISEIAKMYNVSRKTIYNIIQNKLYRDV